MSENSGVRVGLVAYGRGVFASRSFSNGEIVGVISGVVHDDAEYSSDYCMDLGGTLSLEPKAPFRYINHSCEPNAELFFIPPDEPEDDPVPILIVEATREIQPGDEITIDYAWAAEHAIPCHCRAVRCRGWIVATDEAEGLQVPQPTR